jgi:hypothetical protein
MEMAVKNLKALQSTISESNANDEYYIFLLPVTSDSHIQVFYEKDFDEIKYLELKDVIDKALEEFRQFSKEKDKKNKKSSGLNRFFE